MSKLYILFLCVLVHNFDCFHCISHNFKSNVANNLPDMFGIRRTMFDLNEARNGKLLVTNLDNFRNLFVIARHMSLRYAFDHIEEIFQKQREHGKVQEFVSLSENFPCNLSQARSPEPPNTVHRVRPGDIDVIASIGDSLSAGNGIISESIVHILNEFRGISFAGGGLGNWRKFLTLPNILKVFNPQLYGYSTSDGLVVDRSSRLNIAEPMIMSRDLPFQARLIIDRMRRDPHIDMQQHWKLLTIFLGNNDLCSDMCHHDNNVEFLQQHEHDLRQAFTMLRDNVPRLIVNLVPAPNMVTTLYPMRGLPLLCEAVHLIGCHCVFSERIKGAKLQAVSDLITRWQHVDQYVASLSEFQTNDFSVIYQPFTANVTVPTLANGGTDLRYFASDCFHFSQLGHASMANSLWSNMLQPVGAKKSKMMLTFGKFDCPTEEHPYIGTWKNSLDDGN